jgi:DNA polymerase III delta prime subunit
MNYLPSIIISSPNQTFCQTSLDQILTSLSLPTNSTTHPDITVINSQTGWGIDQIRRFKTITQSRPVKAKNRAIIIYQAQNLTIQAQNSLLKILEEPPQATTLILITDNLSKLSDTIQSRCQIIKFGRGKTKNQDSLIISQKLSDNLNLSVQICKDKNSCLKTIQNQIIFYQKQLLGDPKPDIKHKIRLLQKSLSMLNSNVNPISTFDFFFLSI